MSNVDTVYIKYHDLCKRKFVWKLWERKSGNYETYADFKESWDPKTSIWQEIKQRTKKDVHADIENILDRTMKGWGKTIPIKNEVPNLVQETQPFSNPVQESVEQPSHSSNRDGSKHKHSSSRTQHNSSKHSHHKHSHSTHRNHNHSQNRSVSPNHSHSRHHSHSRSHSNNRRHLHNRQRTHSTNRIHHTSSSRQN
jgi:hypothetical protein